MMSSGTAFEGSGAAYYLRTQPGVWALPKGAMPALLWGPRHGCRQVPHSLDRTVSSQNFPPDNTGFVESREAFTGTSQVHSLVQAQYR